MGADLSLTGKPAQEVSYRVLVESATPVWKGGKASSSSTRVDLSLKVKSAAPDATGIVSVTAEVTEGTQDIDGNPRPGSLAGQKLGWTMSALRGFNQWQGLSVPAGPELFDLGLPKAKVGKDAPWTVKTSRLLVRQQEEVPYDRSYSFEGEAQLGGEDAFRLSLSIAAVKKVLAAGAQIDFTGSGEVWISKKDGRVMKATEVLEGRLLDEKASKDPGRFAQGITIMDANLAPPKIASLIEKGAVAPAPAPAAAPVPAASGGSPTTAGTSGAPGTPVAGGSGAPVTAPAPTGTLVERLVFVSRGTGKREIWSVAPDGSGKRCLSGFTHEYWSPSVDPEGRTVACVSVHPEGTNVWSLGLVTADRAPLTEFGERDDISVTWCAGGQRLAFLRNGKLWSVHRDGFNLQSFAVGGRIVALEATNATSQVAVVTNELNQNKIVVVDVLTGAVKELFEGDMPSWSPDGASLVYRTVDSITLANADGSGIKQLLKGLFADGPIVWESTGKRVAVSKIEANQTDVYLVETAPESKVTRVTFRGGTACAMSPAADRVAYLLDGDLWIGTADGNRHTHLTEDGMTELPVWWGKHYVP